MKKLILICLCFINASQANPKEAIPLLRGTYTPFLSGPLAEHKGLSPLSGAIAWYCWIAGFYTWGPGIMEKVVPVTQRDEQVEEQIPQSASAEQVPTQQHPIREKFKLADADATMQLVHDLFYEPSPGDIQPTVSQSHPFVVILRDTRSDLLGKFLTWVREQTDANKKALLAGLPKGNFKNNLPKFLKIITQSSNEYCDGKPYPSFVTEQILAAYWFSVQFKDEMRKTNDGRIIPIQEHLPIALHRYMHALGVSKYKPESYSPTELASDETCPTTINELALIRKLYDQLVVFTRPPLVNWSHFDYRGAGNVGNCVETMILNFFNFILYDPATEKYTLDQLPEETKQKIHARLRNFYEANTDVKKTNDRATINAWLEAISGLTDGVQTPTASSIVYKKRNSYTFDGVTKEGSFELLSDPNNELSVINYLLGTKAPTFEDLAPLLSTSEHKITINSPKAGQFIVQIGGEKVTFTMDVGHSFATVDNTCKMQQRSLHNDDEFMRLQYALLTQDIPTPYHRQQTLYVLYAMASNINRLAYAIDDVFSHAIADKNTTEFEFRLVKKLLKNIPDVRRVLKFSAKTTEQIWDNNNDEQLALLLAINTNIWNAQRFTERLKNSSNDANKKAKFNKLIDIIKNLQDYSPEGITLPASLGGDLNSLSDDDLLYLIVMSKKYRTFDLPDIRNQITAERKNNLLIKAIADHKYYPSISALFDAGAVATAATNLTHLHAACLALPDKNIVPFLLSINQDQRDALLHIALKKAFEGKGTKSGLYNFLFAKDLINSGANISPTTDLNHLYEIIDNSSTLPTIWSKITPEQKNAIIAMAKKEDLYEFVLLDKLSKLELKRE